MQDYQENYSALNAAQRQAVDTIEGPVMVVAGPGTGKTQLLSMRVAAILARADVPAGAILCLTFTESAAAEMRQRLLRLIGPDAYKVAIHTFHSFGTEIISQYPEYFYHGAHFRAADDLSGFELLEPIFAALPHRSPLASKMNGQFTALRDVRQAIGQLKKAGLTPDELLKILDHNQTCLDSAEPLLARAFDVPRLSKKHLGVLRETAGQLAAFTPADIPLGQFKPLAQLLVNELEAALDQAEADNSTKPITAWRERWLERDHTRAFVFKDRARGKKLRDLADIYHKYLLAMQKAELFDFDDMILRVSHALEYFPELRYNLQERYLYIMVDEFQDTNGAQMRLVHNLTNAEVNAGRPNIMVVGDDDQAIYAFQGAEIGNILQFSELYRDPAIITLTENYRSTDVILQSARAVITQGSYRLETSMQNINKTLHAHNAATPTLSELHSFSDPTAQYAWIAHAIKAHPGRSGIAVLARNHKQLLELLPFLYQAGIAVNYERRNNVLDAEHIVALIVLARTIVAIAKQEYEQTEALLPQLLSYPFWGLTSEDVWHISLETYKRQEMWLEHMLSHEDKLHEIAEFLVIASQAAQHESLDTMLDMLLGTEEIQVNDDDQASDTNPRSDGPHEQFTSPIRAHYFTAQRLQTQPEQYLGMLSNLAVLRRALREYRPDQALKLEDFVDFIDLHAQTNTPIVDTSAHHESADAVTLMTAHKAKGLEFETVFVLSCQDTIWGGSARTKPANLRFPHNLPIESVGQGLDDMLRLFFVAMTRAKRQLYMCSYQYDTSNKASLGVSFLQAMPIIVHNEKVAASTLARSLEPGWHTQHLRVSHASRETLLRPVLEKYKLSATHLNNFIDTTNGGPQAFLLQNLLRFPQAMPPNAAFGSAVHAALQRAHVHLTTTGERRPTEDIVHDFEQHLSGARLSERDYQHFVEKGGDVLQAFLTARHESFTPGQRVEYSFAAQGVVIGNARLTGAIDLLEIDEPNKAIIVTDYKTGKPSNSWQGKTDYEKIKLHKYRQQLMMYKLLVERSRDLGGYTVSQGIVEFVEAGSDSSHQRLVMTFTDDELLRFRQLLQAVWQHIMTLDLPDTSHYEQSYRGIIAFEADLLKDTPQAKS